MPFGGMRRSFLSRVSFVNVMEGLTIAAAIAAVVPVQSFAYDGGNTEFEPVRKKRNVLIFPPSSVLQLTIGVSTVLDLVGNPSGQISYAFQQNVALPTNYTELLFPPTLKTKRSLNIHHHLQRFFGSSTINGTECLKKVICQVAEAPLGGGLLEEILTFAFTPSNHKDLFGHGTERHPFLISESIGRNSGDCHSQFPDCHRSPLDLIARMDNHHP